MSIADPTTAESAVMPGDGQTTKEIVKRADAAHVEVMPMMGEGELRQAWRLAQSLAASGMFKDATQAEQALAKILLGRDLGLSPTQSMTGIHIVEGKPEIAAVTLASFVRRREDMRYHVVEHTDQACELHFYGGVPTGVEIVAVHHAETCPAHVDPEGKCGCNPSKQLEGEWFLGRSRFTHEDAERAELLKPTRNGHPSNHTKYPRNMKFARAMSNGIKWYVPEATGGIPVYHEGEVYQAAIEAPEAAAEEMRTLPPALAELLEQAQAIDSQRWRRNEILARLPHPDDNTFVPTVDGIAAEMKAWLAENEAEEAEVVEGEPAEHADGDPVGLAERYRTDQEWREKVDVLLSRHADLEAALPDAEESDAEQAREELGRIEGDLDALGVPIGWYPPTEVAEGQAELEL